MLLGIEPLKGGGMPGEANVEGLVSGSPAPIGLFLVAVVEPDVLLDLPTGSFFSYSSSPETGDWEGGKKWKNERTPLLSFCGSMPG